jgi:hypothetical protein
LVHQYISGSNPAGPGEVKAIALLNLGSSRDFIGKLVVAPRITGTRK